MAFLEVSAAKGVSCPICSGETELLDVVDFNKTCRENEGVFFDLCGKPIYYSICTSCGFAFAPEMHQWSRDEFVERIYNDDYIAVDPEYAETRPQRGADSLMAIFPDASGIGHLDYGGGAGILSARLRQAGWRSQSYDPLVDGDDRLPARTFDLVTAFEVFEHVPSVAQLMADLTSLTHSQSVILFTTLVSDGSIRRGSRLSWWYAAPRNGHISLYSRESLSRLGQQHGFGFGSFDDNWHLFCRPDVPAWARHIVKPG